MLKSHSPLKHAASLCFVFTLAVPGYGPYSPETIDSGFLIGRHIAAGLHAKTVIHETLPVKNTGTAFDTISLNYRITKVILKSA